MFTSYEGRLMYADTIEKSFWQLVRVGFAPYLANYNDVNTWLMLQVNGVRAGSVFNALFWEALAVAIPAGYIAAFPVNFWLIGKEMKRCH